MKQHIDKFVDYLRYERNASPNTIREYRRDVTQFMLARAMALREGTASPEAPLFCAVRAKRRILVCREAALDL